MNHHQLIEEIENKIEGVVVAIRNRGAGIEVIITHTDEPVMMTRPVYYGQDSITPAGRAILGQVRQIVSKHRPDTIAIDKVWFGYIY